MYNAIVGYEVNLNWKSTTTTITRRGTKKTITELLHERGFSQDEIDKAQWNPLTHEEMEHFVRLASIKIDLLVSNSIALNQI